MRIIAGNFKGRKILTNTKTLYEGFIPVQNIVREYIFNKLEHNYSDTLKNSSVLDLCCGTGIISFEAISRGAHNSTLIDICNIHRKFIINSALNFKISDKINFICTDARYLKCKKQFDIIFIDPPYSMNIAGEIFNNIYSKNKLIQNNGCIILKTFTSDNNTIYYNDNSKYNLCSEKTYGSSKILIFVNKCDDTN